MLYVSWLLVPGGLGEPKPSSFYYGWPKSLGPMSSSSSASSNAETSRRLLLPNSYTVAEVAEALVAWVGSPSLGICLSCWVVLVSETSEPFVPPSFIRGDT